VVKNENLKEYMTSEHLLNAGHEVLQEEEDPESGWTLLNPVCPTYVSFNSQLFNIIHTLSRISPVQNAQQVKS